MPQNEYIKKSIKKYGKRLDNDERLRKKEARSAHVTSKKAKKLRGLKAKMYNKQRYKEKAEMKKTIKAHEQKNGEVKAKTPEAAKPTYLLDREETNRSKILSNTIKQKRKEKAGKWSVPIPVVKPMTEDEMFQVKTSGKRHRKAWKRVINKVSFVGDNFTRKPPKFERFIRPHALRFKKANVTHPELKTTFMLDILGVKRNPQSTLYTG